MTRRKMTPRDLLDRFVNIADVAGDVAEALEGVGGDVGRKAKEAATKLRAAADLGVATARAAERFTHERERVASELRETAATIENPPGLFATINGVRTPLKVVPRPREEEDDDPPKRKRRRR